MILRGATPRLPFASLNIQGLLTSGRQKKEAVLQFLRSEDIEVLALQETWLTSSHKFPESHLEGYRELRATRPSRKRGGASLYISNDITVLKHGVTSNNHCAAVMAKIKEYNCIVVSLYCPP